MGRSENHTGLKFQTAIGRAMKRTGTMVLLSSHSPGWNRDHAMGITASIPQR